VTTTAPYRRAGSTRRDPWSVWLSPEQAGWSWTGLRVLDLEAGGSTTFSTGDAEVVVLPLSGSCAVECDGERFDLVGRSGVFVGQTDFAYAPRDATVHVHSEAGGRFALPAAKAARRLAFRYGEAGGAPVEVRGAGMCSRIVNNFCTPESFETDRLIACEVITPGGNWSSYPPHKHDEDRPGESVLEEIYYFEVAEGPAGPGLGYQRVYGTDARPIDVLVEVRSGDVVLVPYGWHGPSIAAPGHDMYYLNAMAGPGARAWHISDDPDHAWVRRAWRDQAVDPRVLAALPEGRSA
jgi:5-deoxy-glucuronate isomerase